MKAVVQASVNQGTSSPILVSQNSKRNQPHNSNKSTKAQAARTKAYILADSDHNYN